MKTKSLILFLFISFLSLSSFSQKRIQKQILGTWYNTSNVVQKIDEVSKVLLKENISYLQKQKDNYSSQIASMDDSSKIEYEQIIANIDKQLKELNVDTIKNDIQENYNIGTFIFNKDKTLTIKSGLDSIIGTWSIFSDTLSINVQDKEVPLLIKNINKKKLTLIQKNNIDSLKFDINYNFEKQ